ncbi:MAG: DNRLRE domain-containing protein [Thermoflexales bacterium]|nr:DNRLRE domain-containing protein [Thermoflexales bacterium]
MNKDIARQVVGIALAMVIVLGSTVSVSSSNSPVQATQSDEANSLVILRADPAVNRSFVAPPAEFGLLRAQSATITVNYLAGGTKDVYDFSCNTWPVEPRQAFDYAVSIWASQINSSVPIVINACWTTLEPGVLGYGGAPYRRNFTNAPRSSTWYPVALANALAGYDLNGSNAEINVGYSSEFNWYYGTDGNTPSDRYDFASVVLHEVCHGLGFSGSMEVSGGLGSWGSNGDPDIYDRFTENGSGQSLLDTGLFPNPSTALAAQLTSGNLYFDGPNANAANGGARPKLYAPGTWSQGSSYSHLDEIFNGTPNALMTYSLGRAEANHSPGPIALGLLKDVGWTIGSTPLPAPTLASITPQQGVNNSAVDFSLSGGNFQAGASVALSMAGQADIQAFNLAVSTSLITGRFDLNGVTTGQWSVVVTNPDEQSATLENGFTVAAPPPALTSITPNQGVNNNAAFNFTLAGSGFQVLADVALSRSGQSPIKATHLSVSASQITGRFNLDGAAVGQWNVIVTNTLDGQNAILVNGFRVVYPPPGLASITPNSGSNTGIVSITDLAGSYFQAEASVKLSRVGQADIRAANVNVASAAQITCDLDLSGAATGDWDVVVTNPDGQSATLADGFEVVFSGKTWTGAENRDWHTGGNWEPAGVPTATDDVRIPDVARDPLISGTAAAANHVIVDAGAVLDLGSSSLNAEGTVVNNGTLAQSLHVMGQTSTPFLRITDLAGGQAKYQGLDIMITGPGTLYMPGVVVTASVSGNQLCAGRTTGVQRCFDIRPAQAMSATVRFYFDEAERSGYSLDELLVVHEGAAWTEEPGPYTRGVEGSAQYVEAQNVDDFSRFGLDKAASGIFYIYLPMVAKNWPPVPYAPNLVVASNDGNGNYSLNWSMPPMPAAIPPVTGYKLQEANNSQFTAASDTSLSDSSYTVASKSPGSYWYRVAARNSYGYGTWSSPQQLVVNPPGTFYAVEDAYILQGRPDTNYGTASTMWAGYDDYLNPDGMIARSMVKFDLSVVPADAVLNSAVLRVYKGASYDFDGEWRTITAYRISSAWSESSVTWNTRPDYSTAYGSASVPHDTYDWHSFDVTGLVQGWINGHLANFGIMLRGPEWSGNDSSWKAFYTRERGDPYTPQLVLNYANYVVSDSARSPDDAPVEGVHVARQPAPTIKGLAGER